MYCLLYPKHSTWLWLRATKPQGPKNVHNFLKTVRAVSWDCGHVTQMLLIIKKTIFDLIIRGQVLDMTVQRNVPRFCTRSICGWNLFQPLGLPVSWIKANTERWPRVHLMLGQRHGRCANSNPISFCHRARLVKLKISLKLPVERWLMSLYTEGKQADTITEVLTSSKDTIREWCSPKSSPRSKDADCPRSWPRSINGLLSRSALWRIPSW